MKKKTIIAAIAAVLAVGIGLGAKRVLKDSEIKGCEKTVVYQLQQTYGEIPEDVKAKITSKIDDECRQIL